MRCTALRLLPVVNEIVRWDDGRNLRAILESLRTRTFRKCHVSIYTSTIGDLTVPARTHLRLTDCVLRGKITGHGVIVLNDGCIVY